MLSGGSAPICGAADLSNFQIGFPLTNSLGNAMKQENICLASRNPVQIRGGPAAVIGDGKGRGISPATVRVYPDGKAVPNRKNRKSEDLSGRKQATPDGKGSSIEPMGLPFFFASHKGAKTFTSRKDAKAQRKDARQ